MTRMGGSLPSRGGGRDDFGDGTHGPTDAAAYAQARAVRHLILKNADLASRAGQPEVGIKMIRVLSERRRVRDPA